MVHDPLNPVCLEVIAPDSDNNGRRKESRSGSLPDIQVEMQIQVKVKYMY